MLRTILAAFLVLLAVHIARADEPPPDNTPDCMLREATNVGTVKLTVDTNHLADIEASGGISYWDDEGDGELVWRDLDNGVASYELMILSCAPRDGNNSEYEDADSTVVQLDHVSVSAFRTIKIFGQHNQVVLSVAAARQAPSSQPACVPKPVFSIDDAEILFMVPDQHLVVKGTAPSTGWTDIQLQLVSPVPDTFASLFTGAIATYQLVGCPPAIGADVLTPLDETRIYLLPGLRQIIIKASSNEKILGPDDLPY